jgi:hypothetical protein
MASCNVFVKRRTDIVSRLLKYPSLIQERTEFTLEDKLVQELI